MANTQVSDQAVQLLVDRVKLPAFREKLARDWGINPTTQAELNQLVEMAGILSAAKAQEQVKQASSGNPFLSSALDGLKSALGQEGVDAGPNSQQQMLKQAAFNVTSRQSDVAYAALEYANYLSTLDGQ